MKWVSSITRGVTWALIFSRAIFLCGGASTQQGAFSSSHSSTPSFSLTSHHISPTRYRLAHWFNSPLSLSLCLYLALLISQSLPTSLPAYTNPSIFQFLFFPCLPSLLSITDLFARSSSQPPFLFFHLFFFSPPFKSTPQSSLCESED